MTRERFFYFVPDEDVHAFQDLGWTPQSVASAHSILMAWEGEGEPKQPPRSNPEAPEGLSEREG